MAVRAKFYVHSVTRQQVGGSVELRAVCRGDENKVWSQYTPSGALTMSILNEPALEWFDEVRRAKKPEVFINFELATADDAEVLDGKTAE